MFRLGQNGMHESDECESLSIDMHQQWVGDGSASGHLIPPQEYAADEGSARCRLSLGAVQQLDLTPGKLRYIDTVAGSYFLLRLIPVACVVFTLRYRGSGDTCTAWHC